MTDDKVRNNAMSSIKKQPLYDTSTILQVEVLATDVFKTLLYKLKKRRGNVFGGVLTTVMERSYVYKLFFLWKELERRSTCVLQTGRRQCLEESRVCLQVFCVHKTVLYLLLQLVKNGKGKVYIFVECGASRDFDFDDTKHCMTSIYLSDF